MNTTAANILRVNIKDWVGNTLCKVTEQYLHLRVFQDAFNLKLAQIEQSHANEWQTEISIEQQNKRLLLVCRGAILPIDHQGQRGVVLVFDDVSELIQAEHDAAWGEVARRLAHEIKNPLTPIQLSAERLVRKLEKELSEDSNQFLKRMTQTIIQQVDNLKSMVNAFSDYAKTPAVNLQLADLNNLVQDTAELYKANEKQADIQLELAPHLPKLRLDTNRMRQLLVNLIKNALEALDDTSMKGCITLKTTLYAHYVQLDIADNGPGIPTELLPRLFEPYVTSKHKGTGLGLAIVKKIVEEHAGSISAHNNPEKGAMISIQFPLLADAK
jgi:nitrogen fixation/metabolism regulation signal transduction histidine kinase